jgi:ribose-phosphate pyrophosphokinase
MTAQSQLRTSPEAHPRPGGGDRLRVFALQATTELGNGIADALGQPLAAHEEREFEDGEHKGRPLENVRDADVYVVQSLHGGPTQSANDKLCRLLFFIGALKDAGAARVTAVAPYLCYARKDRRTKPGDPVTTRYVAGLFEAVGTDAIVTLEVHNPAAFENAFRCPAVSLTAAPLFVDRVKAMGRESLCVVSPDPGGVKRAELFREALEAAVGKPVGKGFADKHRSAGIVTGDLFVGDVAGATVLIVDDLISTGGTLLRAARAARNAGARRVIALVTHGLFMPGAAEVIADPAIERIVVTDTVALPRCPLGPRASRPPFSSSLSEGAGGTPTVLKGSEGEIQRNKIDTIPVAPLLAEAIRRLHHGLALTDLMVF